MHLSAHKNRKIIDKQRKGVVRVPVMKKIKKCPTCGKSFTGQRKYCSYLCSIPATMEANKQLKEKKGAIYEKWKARLKAVIR